MSPKDFRELAQDPRFISGLYNYCDRWCERCPLSSRCMLYASEQIDEKEDPSAGDVDDEAFVEKMHQVFAQTKEMLLGMAADQGIDLTQEDDEEFDRREQERTARIRSSAPARRAEEYGKNVEVWFKKHGKLFRKKGRALQKAVLMELPNADPRAEAAAIADAVEVIRWYQQQIHVKLMRALSSRDDAKEWGEDEDLPSDADGSAKVALIGIAKSINAWSSLRQHLDDHTDSILDILKDLDHLQRLTLEEFPQAPRFRRPGFDDPA